jgi:cell division protein FtsI (penicillin-binding protein 3)
LYRPKLIKKIEDPGGEEINTMVHKEIRRVISKETSNKIKKMMVGVVENGTGKNAKLNFISVGGKTGTSQKLINGRYSKSEYNSSFIGFFPVNHPQILCFVLVNSPSVGKYGGAVAAPIFKNISERIISSDPDLFQDQIKNYKDQEFEYKTVNLKNYDKEVSVKVIHADNEITKKINKGDFNNIKIMPDLSNYSLRDAIQVLTKLGITYKVKGSGKVISQTVNPGNKIDRSQICVLTCENNNVGAKIY